jgi:hypothetical protein
VLAEFSQTKWMDCDPGRPPDDAETLRGEIKTMIEKATLRRARADEIRAQSNGLATYWMRMLMLAPGSHPGTVGLVAAGIAVGHMVGMHWKWHYQRARPSQVYPGLIPMIAVPPHPAWPSGHGLQSYMVARCLIAGLPKPVGDALAKPIGALADRITDNRVIAGVHFPGDQVASARIAKGIMPLLEGCSRFKALVAMAQAEWKGVSAGGLPEVPFVKDAEKPAP